MLIRNTQDDKIEVRLIEDIVMKTALLIIDMQQAYFNNTALEKNKNRLVGAINELIVSARQHKLQIFNVITEHADDKTTWSLNMLDDGVGYLHKDSRDVQNVSGLDTDGLTTVVKTRDSAFFGTNLLSMLRTKNIEHIILCGVSTHSCIMMTAADAYAANIRVTLAKDAIASHDPDFHQSTLAMLEKEYRQYSLTNQEIEQSLK